MMRNSDCQVCSYKKSRGAGETCVGLEIWPLSDFRHHLGGRHRAGPRTSIRSEIVLVTFVNRTPPKSVYTLVKLIIFTNVIDVYKCTFVNLVKMINKCIFIKLKQQIISILIKFISSNGINSLSASAVALNSGLIFVSLY